MLTHRTGFRVSHLIRKQGETGKFLKIYEILWNSGSDTATLRIAQNAWGDPVPPPPLVGIHGLCAFVHILLDGTLEVHSKWLSTKQSNTRTIQPNQLFGWEWVKQGSRAGGGAPSLTETIEALDTSQVSPNLGFRVLGFRV